jgi:2,4-diketo-3-deoxy-L-fuconate hydrolase
MRIANVQGRLKLLVPGGAVDVAQASAGRFGPSPQDAIARLGEIRQWSAAVTQADEAWDPAAAGPPLPLPRQVFAVGLNYDAHVTESGFSRPVEPVVFTKYVSSLSGPVTEVVLPGAAVDWEVELVVAIGATARQVPTGQAWDFVAGLTVGQDISERDVQRQGPAPQFCLAKSFPGFSPTGPALVTVDEVEDRDDLGLGCEVNGGQAQKGRTSDMLFPVAELIAYLSSILTLFPGDLIFTGTPPGVGMGRTPPQYLQAGDVLTSWVEGIGGLEQRFVAGPSTPAPVAG